jgi:pyruvate kinase
LARLISKYRPEVNILACSVNASAVRQMAAIRGVIGLKLATLMAAICLTADAFTEQAKIHFKQNDKKPISDLLL